MKNTERLKKCIFTSILAALSIVLYVLGPKFPLPSLFPSFLELNFSLLPIILACFICGTKYGFVVVLIRFIIKLCFGTSTAGIGETADLIIGLVVVVTIFLANRIFKDKCHYVPTFIFVILGVVLGGILSNIFALPMYIKVMGFTKETFVNMLSSIHKNCTIDNFLFYYFVCAIIPFNLLLGSILSLISYLVWIPLNKANIKF